MLASERECGIDRFEYFADFAERVANLRAALRSKITELKEKGALVSVCDIREDHAKAVAEEHGFTHVVHGGHHRLEVDIYAPCARGAGVNDKTIGELRCKAIAGCANNILLDDRHGDELKSRGILYAPDYVINAAGIINVGVEVGPGGYDEQRAFERIDRIYDNLKEVFEISRTEGIGAHTAADRLAERRLAAARSAQGA